MSRCPGMQTQNNTPFTTTMGGGGGGGRGFMGRRYYLHGAWLVKQGDDGAGAEPSTGPTQRLPSQVRRALPAPPRAGSATFGRRIRRERRTHGKHASIDISLSFLLEDLSFNRARLEKPVFGLGGHRNSTLLPFLQNKASLFFSYFYNGLAFRLFRGSSGALSVFEPCVYGPVRAGTGSGAGRVRP
jgi:hypothetical protein